jgi:hypothetical protein
VNPSPRYPQAPPRRTPSRGGELSVSGARGAPRASSVAPPPGGLAPFDALPVETQHAIVRAVEREDAWRIAGYELGRWHGATVRRLQALVSRTAPGALSAGLQLVTSLLRSGPARGLHAVFRAWRGLRLTKTSRLLTLLAGSGVRPWDLAVCYARGIRQPAGYRGYWHDRATANTVAIVVGIDFIPAEDGVWFVEGNLDAALRGERSDLYERDPFVANLVDFAATRGYARLVVIPGNRVQWDPRMRERCERECAARGLVLTVVEDKFISVAREPRGYRIPPWSGQRTLVARIRRFHTALDHLVGEKRAAARVLRAHIDETRDTSFLLPTTGSVRSLFEPRGDEPFPNLVYKLAEFDQGKAVVFVKADSPDQAESSLRREILARRPRGINNALAFRLGGGAGLFQAYVRAIPRKDGRQSIMRAHMLISPVGNRFLSAHRVVAAVPVPTELPFGVVGDSRPYLVNFSAGARYETIPPEEEARIRVAAEGVASGFARAIAFGFETGPAERGKGDIQ